ncbi:MAG: hypothetical protein AAGA83_09100 [Cyanobacteria bacterium P01_F01_bin.116]
MRYWEFLIQQEGDQTWLPLETRQVEILEGRYRMAAHTSYDDTSVEVRVSQLLLDEIPPRRRVRKRKSVTNDSGLLAIFPFMQLSPGRWEIDCNSPDVIDDFLGEPWHYSVQLQVTPRDEDDWDPDWSDRTVVEHGLHAEAVGGADMTAEAGEEDSEATEFKLELKQQAYVTEVGQPLTLTGHVSQVAGGRLFDGQLWVELRDPQTASILQELPFELTLKRLPSPFSVTITLPAELSTQVVLGAISLHPGQTKATRSQPTQTALASTAFTVTIGLAQMLDAIASQPDVEFEEEISIFPGSTESFVPPPEKTEALITRDIPIVPKELIPSEGLTLPPQIKPLSGDDDDPDRQPELPEFPAKTSRLPRPVAADPVDETPTEIPAATDPVELPEAPLESPVAEMANEPIEEALVSEILADESLPETSSLDQANPSPPEEEAFENEVFENEVFENDAFADEAVDALDDIVEPSVAPSEPPAFAEPKVFHLGSIEDDDLDLELAAAAQAEDARPPSRPEFRTEMLPVEPTPVYRQPTPSAQPNVDDASTRIDRAFEKLQLRERFWQKLSSFTHDGYRESLEVKRALQLSDTLPEGNQQTNEFVAYEPQRIESRIESRIEQAEPTEPVQVEPPILEVPPQELVAGEWLAIKVRVPVANYQPYVKVWMNDLQTRTVIEAPRMLMQFTPNDFNELETLMRVKVPSGCLELQIAAISVDMSTLQESRKVVQNRRVMPPDNTIPLFDDWDL